jgi:hypothetical protein
VALAATVLFGHGLAIWVPLLLLITQRPLEALLSHLPPVGTWVVLVPDFAGATPLADRSGATLWPSLRALLGLLLLARIVPLLRGWIRGRGWRRMRRPESA